jgi:hypothetical protein
MIPRIVHQTWKSDRIPKQFATYAASWEHFNPSWQRILWTDRLLLEFVKQNYPDILELYCSYSNPVCRADAARYMLLHKFGGLYADIDVECLAPLTSLENEARAVLCHEPPSHWPASAPLRSHPFILFNGVMASPAGHPFWRSVLGRLHETRHGTSIIDMTGPCLLGGVYLGYENKDAVKVHSCQIFTPIDKSKQDCPPYGESVPVSLTNHHWAGTWLDSDWRRKLPHRRLISAYHRLRYQLKSGPALDLETVRRQIAPHALSQPACEGDRLAIFVPLRNAASQLDEFVEAISTLDAPKKNTKLVFCVYDSVDGTLEKLYALAPDLRQIYASLVVLTKEFGTQFNGTGRSERTRLARLATVRNHLIDRGLDEADDWVLWVDVGARHFPTDLFQRLRSVEARIVAPNCVKDSGGPTFDMSSFVEDWHLLKRSYHRHVRDGLFQPPPPCPGRLYLADLRHSERVELDGVGGATLLVEANLHRNGLRFPEIPYKDLIDTEGFGLLARDLGIRAVGLPRLEVVHAGC